MKHNGLSLFFLILNESSIDLELQLIQPFNTWNDGISNIKDVSNFILTPGRRQMVGEFH